MGEDLDIYVSIDEARNEIRARWLDRDLYVVTERFLSKKMPDVFRREPRAILSRNIATPNLEFWHFVELAHKAGLKPAVFEGAHDKFVSANSDKMKLVKLGFLDEHGVNNTIHYRKIINIPANDGKMFDEIETTWGENLVDFHHRLLTTCVAGHVDVFDDFMWFDDVGVKNSIDQYYKNFLCFFVCHGVLFEDFVTTEREMEFFEKTVRPAIEFVKKTFGVAPLIIKLGQEAVLDDPYLQCYASYIEKCAFDLKQKKYELQFDHKC